MRLGGAFCLTSRLQLVQAGLAGVEKVESRRPVLEQPSRQLRADGAGGAGDHHDLALDGGQALLFVHAHGLARQQVLHRDFAHRIPGSPLQDFRGRRHHAHGHLCRLDNRQQLLQAGRYFGWQGEGHQRDVILFDRGRDVVAVANHGDAVDALALEAGVVVDEAGGAVGLIAVRAQLSRQGAPGLAGADDEDALLRARVVGRRQPRCGGEARQHAQHGVEEKDEGGADHVHGQRDRALGQQVVDD